MIEWRGKHWLRRVILPFIVLIDSDGNNKPYDFRYKNEMRLINAGINIWIVWTNKMDLLLFISVWINNLQFSLIIHSASYVLCSFHALHVCMHSQCWLHCETVENVKFERTRKLLLTQMLCCTYLSFEEMHLIVRDPPPENK